jgi:hypothetical protein
MLIPEHPSWKILDSTKLDTYDRCPRLFFYQYLLGWKLDQPAHDLHFGESWHMAREYQLINGYSEIDGAFQSFIQHYRLEFPEESDALCRPKNPEGVRHALANFAVSYSRDLMDNELLRNPETNEPFTEISGTVPISDTRFLHFRMDSILRNLQSGKIFSWDHKSSSTYIKYDMWDMQFPLSIQNGTYTHCLYCLFPIDKVLGVEFCGCGFEYLSRGSAQRPPGCYSILKRYPAYKTPQQMNVWLWEVNNLWEQIENDLDRLSQCNDSDSVLQCFPRRPSSCTKYRGCEFHPYCISWDNPLRRCQEPPIGFKQEFWNPAEKDSRNKMQLSWK